MRGFGVRRRELLKGVAVVVEEGKLGESREGERRVREGS